MIGGLVVRSWIVAFVQINANALNLEPLKHPKPRNPHASCARHSTPRKAQNPLRVSPGATEPIS